MASAAGNVMAQAATPQLASDLDEIVVTGFRASLQDNLAEKRAAVGLMEVINAEDIADFPAANLAEALQRVPGLAIDRDGGEGRSVTVRGLGGEFTRVRIMGLEALATTGGKDSSGGANRGRGFDFQVFASELFDQVTVRKSSQAAVEEGSLGATIDLSPASPFGQPAGALLASAQAGYNDLSRSVDPRLAFLVSERVLDDRLAVVISGAYSTRRTFEEGGSSGRWENPAVPTNSGGCFQSPGPCDRAAGVYSAVNSAWHPRIPRYGRLTYDVERIGLTGAVEYRPGPDTTLSLSGLFSRWAGERDEQYLGLFSGWHRRQGMDQTDVREPVIDDQNQLVSAVLDDVDVRSESRYDELSTTFGQVVVSVDQHFGDRLRLNARLGASRSDQDNPVQTTVSIDRYDQDGVVQDFAVSQQLPLMDYGFDLEDPASWSLQPSAALGDPSFLRLRPNRTVNDFVNATVDLAYDLNESLVVRTGLNAKRFTFETEEQRRYAIGGFVDGASPLPPGVSLADVTSLLTGFGRGLGLPEGVARTWLAPDARRIAEVFDLNCNCVNAFGDFRVGAENQLGANRDVIEDSLGGYIQLDLKTQILGMPVQADLGVRQVRTETTSGGFVGRSAVQVENAYDDTLPSLNVSIEPWRNWLVRGAASKSMARPQLGFLTPGGSVSNTARTLTIGNPLLLPVRANSYDLAVEWYPAPDVLLSASVFRKDLESYIQTSTQTLAFGDTGLPDTLLANGNTVDTPFLVTQLLNTEGGRLDGFELSAQTPFTGLPAPFDRLGFIGNYTWVDSAVDYIIDSSRTPVVVQRRPLVSLSPQSWNATLYYEYGAVSARLSAAYRDEYLTLVPGGNGNDARGRDQTLHVDASASWAVSDTLTLTFEAINLGDEPESRWISSERRNNEEYGHTGRQFWIGARWRP